MLVQNLIFYIREKLWGVVCLFKSGVDMMSLAKFISAGIALLRLSNLLL